MRALLVAQSLLLWLGHVCAQVRILAPKALAHEFKKNHGVVYGTTATFGAPYYGETVLGQLLYSESKGHAHCEHGDYSMPTPTGRTPPASGSPKQETVKVLLVRRGKCTFVTKVRVAQEKGAHAVIVVDRETSSNTPEDIQSVVMADDGWGDSVQIPSILVSKSEGQLLIDAAKRETVMVELDWNIPRGQVVIMDFWMSAGDRLAMKFLEKFKPYAVALSQHLQFAPRYDIFKPDAGLGSAAERLCVTVDSESFCAPDPDGGGPVTGENVVNEDLRQLCIWNVTARRGASTGALYSEPYWVYVVNFRNRCSLRAANAEQRFGKVCSLKVMRDAGIDTAAVQSCVSQNRGPMLQEQLRNKAWSRLALQLNGWRYSGPLDPQTVLQAVCGGYTTPPEECSSLQQGALSGGALVEMESGGASLATLFAGLFLLAGLLLAAFFFYKRHLTSTVRKVLREEVLLEVQTQMADYVVMDEDGQHRPANHRVLSF